MTMKEMFKKIAAHNEVSEILGTDKVGICFEYDAFHSETIFEYEIFRKYIRHEYVKEVADYILKSDSFEMDRDTEFEWTDCFGKTYNRVARPNLEFC